MDRIGLREAIYHEFIHNALFLDDMGNVADYPHCVMGVIKSVHPGLHFHIYQLLGTISVFKQKGAGGGSISTFIGHVWGPATLIANVPAWVVTLTAPTPHQLVQTQQGTPASDLPAPVRHFNVVINAQTGQFLLGFFTK